MKFIELTLRDGSKVQLNAYQIGSYYETRDGTKVLGCGHNNGGFTVLENMNQIKKLIEG